MNIAEYIYSGKDWFRKVFLALVIILVALLSFGIGRLSVVGKSEPIKIEFDPLVAGSKAETASAVNAVGQGVVGSKNGSKYHFSYCSGAKQIKEENKVTFPNPAAAEASGYTLASNCQSR